MKEDGFCDKALIVSWLRKCAENRAFAAEGEMVSKNSVDSYVDCCDFY